MFNTSRKVVGFSQLPETQREEIIRRNRERAASRDKRKRQEIYATAFCVICMILFVAVSSKYCDKPSGNGKAPVYAREKK